MNSLARDAALLLDFMARLSGGVGLAWLMLGLLAGWWLYVPAHELLHVAGCLLAGGEVSRLELAPLYGGSLLAAWLPFVVSGSDYAGQLTGFDTRGSDLIYQSCVLMPYAITVFPAFWLWQKLLLQSETPGAPRLLAVGALLPAVAAPLLSLTGDYYEAGAIVASRLLAEKLGRSLEAWRDDDLLLLLSQWQASSGPGDAIGIAAGAVIGLLLAVATLWAGSRLGHWLNRPEPGIKRA